MSNQKILSHFNLQLKFKEQTNINNKSYLIKNFVLLDGKNLIGTDVCKCNIYLPFDGLPDVIGQIEVKSENLITDFKKLYLTNFVSKEKFFLSFKFNERLEPQQEFFFKPRQKIFLANLIEFSVKKVYFVDKEESVCFEEPCYQYNLNKVNLSNTKNNYQKNEESDEISAYQDLEEEQYSNEEYSKEEEQYSNEEYSKKEENILEKRDQNNFINDTKVIQDVKNPFNLLKAPENTKKIKKNSAKKILKKKYQKEINTSQKIDNFFKKINEENNQSPKTTIINDFKFIDRALQNKQKLLLNEKERKNKNLNQNDPVLQSKTIFKELQQLSKLEWWISFSNITPNKKHSKILKRLSKMKNVRVIKDFEQFIKKESTNKSVVKALIMDEYKRTYKLIVTMNKNIFPLQYKWLQDVAKNRSISKSPLQYFIKYPENLFNNSELIKCNKNNFLNKQSYEINLLETFKNRQKNQKGFLEKYNVLVLNKCFNNYTTKNLNIYHKERPTNENESVFIMRTIVETADGQFNPLDSLSQVATNLNKNVDNILIVDSFEYKELISIYKKFKIKIFSKENFLNSFLKQNLDCNEIYIPVK